MTFPCLSLHCLWETQTGPDPSGSGFKTISRLAGSYWCRRHHPAALLAVHWGCVLAACLYCGAWCDVAPSPVTKHVFAEGPTCVLCGYQPQYGAAWSPWRQSPGDLSESDEPDCPAEGTACAVWEGEDGTAHPSAPLQAAHYCSRPGAPAIL